MLSRPVTRLGFKRRRGGGGGGLWVGGGGGGGGGLGGVGGGVVVIKLGMARFHPGQARLLRVEHCTAQQSHKPSADTSL